MKKTVATAVMAIAASVSSAAYAGITGKQLKDYSDTAVKVQKGSVDMVGTAFHNGFLMGVHDTANDIFFCMPKHVTREQIDSVARKLLA